MSLTKDRTNPFADVMEELLKKEGTRYSTFRQCKKQAEGELYESGKWDTMSEEDCSPDSCFIWRKTICVTLRSVDGT